MKSFMCKIREPRGILAWHDLMPTLDFKGRRFIENYHYSVEHHTFEFESSLSELPNDVEPSLEGNLLIEGDNLLALKSLLPTHLGKVKCAYMDPPYNTGKEGWVYNDNLTQPQFKDWIGRTVGIEAEDATRHDKWCCMMMPRLKLIQDLLHEEGVVLISIDDNEVHNLRVLMDEVFGEQNRIAQLVWEKTRKNDAKLFSIGHEYILVYAKSLETLRNKKTIWREAKPGAVEILQFYRRMRQKYGDNNDVIEMELRQWFRDLPKNHPSKKLSRYKQVDKWGPWRDRDISWPGGDGPRYDVIHPTTKLPCKVPERGWGFGSIEAMQRQITKGMVEFREDHTEPPILKRHLAIVPEEFEELDESIEADEDIEDTEESEDTVGLQVMPSVIYKQSQVAVKQLRRIMGRKAFNNPKDPEVLARLFQYCTNDNDLILDCTGGSGTTAHSILLLNKMEGGNRRFILTQQAYDSKDDQKKEVNICREITRERIRRVIEGVNSEALGGSFSYAKLSENSLFGAYRELRNAPYEELARYVFYTHSSRPFDRSVVNEETGFIGESDGTAIFLLYTPNDEVDRPLDSQFLENIAKHCDCLRLAVYAEAIAIHRDDLREWKEKNGKDVQSFYLPFELK